jgi:hypothetical protein
MALSKPNMDLDVSENDGALIASPSVPESSDNVRQPDEEDVGEDDESDIEVDIVEKWHAITRLIGATTDEAFPSSPSFDAASPTAFQTYWRGVFEGLRKTVAADPDIPKYVTDPPIKGFQVRFFDEKHPGSCPCCLPEVPASIDLHKEDGVTKDDLVGAIAAHLYEEELPLVYQEAQDGEVKNDKGLLIYSSNWMSGPRTEDGQRTAFVRHVARSHQIADITLYCCSKEEYLEKRAKE